MQLAGLALALFLAQLGTVVVNVALPALRASFAAPFGAVQWVALAYLIALTASVAFAGRLGDRVGRKRLFLASLAAFGIATAACGGAPTLAALVAARALQGAGAAGVAALVFALASEVVPRERMGRAMGLLGAVTSSATMLGPSLGGLVVASTGWRAIFWLMLPLVVAAFGLAARSLPRVAAASAASGALDAALLRNVPLTLGIAMSALMSCVMMANLIVGPFYLVETFRLSLRDVGFVMSIGPLIVVLVSLPAGRLVDRIGARQTTVIGLCCCALGTLAIALLPARLGLVAYVAAVALLSFGYALFQTPNIVAVMNEAPPDLRGAVSGVLNLARNLGFIAGAGLLAAAFAAFGLPATYAVATLLAGVALCLALAALGRSAQYVPLEF